MKSKFFSLFFIFSSLQPFCWAGTEIPLELLNQEARPTVSQIQSLLKIWTPPALPNAKSIPREPNRPRIDLQFHYPIWFKTISEGGPRMIATFEKAFPGATWAFIGRDTAILADLFEAFYLSLGQTNRVARIGMSRGTLDGITNELALRLLTSSNFNFNDLEHPYILVDTVSRGGGRQGRTLLHAVYSEKGSKRPKDWLWYFNFIGLKVATTELPNAPLEKTLEILQKEELKYSATDSNDFFNWHQILVYDDPNRNGDYISINEAGYSHWTGAWHGSYGILNGSPSGKVFAELGEPSSRDIRFAVLQLQAHTVKTAQDEKFLEAVRREAAVMGYRFPTSRPDYIPDPVKQFKIELTQVTSEEDLLDLIQKFHRYNLNRASIFNLIPKVRAQLHSIPYDQTRFTNLLINLIHTLNDEKTGSRKESQFLLNDLCIVFQNELFAYYKNRFFNSNVTAKDIKDLLEVQSHFHQPLFDPNELIDAMVSGQSQLDWITLVQMINQKFHELDTNASVTHPGTSLIERFLQQLSYNCKLFEAALLKADTAEKLEQLFSAITFKLTQDQTVIFQKYWLKTLNPELSSDLLSNIVWKLPEQAGVSFASMHLTSSKTIERFLSVLSHIHIKSQYKTDILRKNLPLIFSWKPTVNQMNELISYSKPNDTQLQIKIVTLALQQIQTWNEFNQLDIPSGRVNDRDFNLAFAEFKRKQPSLIQRFFLPVFRNCLKSMDTAV